MSAVNRLNWNRKEATERAKELGFFSKRKTQVEVITLDQKINWVAWDDAYE